MKVKPPQCCVSLLWGLALLTSATTTTVETNVTNAVAATPTQHVKMHTLSTEIEDHDAVEERVDLTTAVAQVVRNELRPFAGKLVSRTMIDYFHKQNFMVDTMRNFDKMLDVDAINELTYISDSNFNLLVIWFGIKSPEKQEVVLDLLVAQLKANSLSKHHLLNYFKAGKVRANDAFRVIAATVEKKWLMSISTSEMYDALGLSYIRSDEEFVRHVGHLIWHKFEVIGEKEFTSFMLTKMRERSEDEIMWARLIYTLETDKTIQMPLSSVFDELLRSKAGAAGNCRPIDAVKVLTSPELSKVYNDVARTSEEVGAVVVEKLFQWSKDELMWAKLIYVLQNDDSVPPIPSSVFDYLLQPYETIIFGKHQCTPDRAVKYLTSLELSRIVDNFHTDKNFNAKVLTELLTKSHNELMWAKVLFMLKNDNSVAIPLSDVLETLLNSWTEWPYSAPAIAEQTPISMSKAILRNSKFFYLYLYAHFVSDKPDVFLVKKLRERSTDEFVWAQALSALRDDQSVLTPLSGVLDALLHSWIGEPYNAAALADNQPALIGAYKFLLESSVTFQDRLRPPSPQEAMALVKELLERSNDELMWANFLYKLQQDQAFAVVASSAFDALLQSNDAAQTAHHFSPSSMVEYLTSPSFFEKPNDLQSKDDAGAMLLSHLLPTLLPNHVMWAKVLYIIQTGESKSTTLYSDLLISLLKYWTYDVAGVATSSDLFIKSERYLESQSFANLIAYAQFSSENPDVFVLEKLLERSTDEVMWARLLNKLRKEGRDALSGVLNALFYSWIGEPYDAAAASDKERILITAYDYLTSQTLATKYNKKTTSGKRNAEKMVQNRLYKLSVDDMIWAKFLSKLQKDSAVGFPLFRVFQAFLRQ